MLKMLARKLMDAPAPAKPMPKKTVRISPPKKERASVSYSAELIRWEPAFAIDHGQIDEEHKKITRLLNMLYADWMGSQGNLSPKRVLDELSNTMIKHFLHEEAVMADNKCPHLSEHKVVHRVFVRDLRQVGALMRTNAPASEVKPQLLSLTRRLVVDHVLTMDHDMAKYMR